MGKYYYIIRNIFRIQRETGMGLLELSKVRWYVELYGYEGELSTWEFAELLHRHILTYRSNMRD